MSVLIFQNSNLSATYNLPQEIIMISNSSGYHYGQRRSQSVSNESKLLFKLFKYSLGRTSSESIQVCIGNSLEKYYFLNILTHYTKN